MNRQLNCLTVGELKQMLVDIPDNHEVCFEYNGPDANDVVRADGMIIFRNYILLTQKEDNDE